MLLLDCDGVEEGADPTATFKGTTAGQATAFSVRGPTAVRGGRDGKRGCLIPGAPCALIRVHLL